MAQKVDTILHGGAVVLGAGVQQQDIAITGEQIVAIGTAATMPDAGRVIDVTDMHVLPGLIDAHSHFGYDDFAQGTLLSAHGGITTTIPFLGGSDSIAEIIERGQAEAAAGAVIDYAFHVILWPNPDSDYLPLIGGVTEGVARGVRSYKMFMGYRRFGRNLATDDFLYAAFKEMRTHGALPMVHAENADLIFALERDLIAEGKVTPEHYPASRPTICETEAISRAADLARAAASPLYVVHLTTPEGLSIIEGRRAQGQPVYTETCPQYLLLTEAELQRIGPRAKIGPPMRTPEQVEGMWRGVHQGRIPIVASDHSPHDPALKEPGWKNIFYNDDGAPIPFGAPSAETIVPLMYGKGVVERGLPIWWLARVMAENPARMFGLYPRKGVIAVGSDADFTVIDPNATTTFQAERMHSRTGYTPYEGWSATGAPVLTMVRGRVVLENGTIKQERGFGSYLPAGALLPPVYGPVSPLFA
ncbi:MAG: dihydroorotase family protein [Dehalococcoidia bacterium]